ncbi:MAG TPA: hypothetical protein VG275_03475 [Solirubrobacteraceae bacterium]|nr:hypothetical protein [Solirubrobacteraceae bacterium]
MNPWWLGLGPAQAIVTCGEHNHRLRWAEGALTAVDHEDPEAERALAALGGQRCTCVDVLDAWARHEGDQRVLVLASRGPADPIVAQADWMAQLAARPRAVTTAMPAPARVTAPQLLRRRARRRAKAAARAAARATASGWTAYAPVSPGPVGRIPGGTEPEGELVALLGLGGGLQDRLVATVAATWARRFEQPSPELSAARASLMASMQGRLSAAVRSWLGRIDVPIELELIEDGRAPALAERGGAIQAELPFDWLAEVWARGLAVVFGRFCLSASTDDGRTWALTTLGPDFGPPAAIRVELPAA